MLKRSLAVLATTLLVSLAACGDDTDQDATAGDPGASESSENEAFTTGTFAGVAPVGTIDGRVIGTERGPIVERLQQLYRKRLEQDVAGRSRP